jgi:hypothetical protein
VAFAVAVGGAVACGGDDGGGDAGPGPTAPGTSGGAEAAPGAGEPGIGDETFPALGNDDIDVTHYELAFGTTRPRPARPCG